MFEEVGYQFGLPQMLFSYIVKDKYGEQTSERFTEGEDPEGRVHRRIVMGTVGKTLLEAESPHQLVTGVLHCMIGTSRE